MRLLELLIIIRIRIIAIHWKNVIITSCEITKDTTVKQKSIKYNANIIKNIDLVAHFQITDILE